jgi:hypothetical protein
MACSTDKEPDRDISLVTSDEFIQEHLGEQLMILDRHTREIIAEHSDESPRNRPVSPRSLKSSGEIMVVPSRDWCSGFYPGCLWLMVELTDEEQWKTLAGDYTEPLEREKTNASTHDMGFKMMCSFGNGYRLTENPDYRDILIKSAQTLITRYNENVGCIRSWDFNKDVWQFPVIIDNMMNLELLFWATRETGDSIYHQIAEQHALTTLKNHFRKDHSSYHVIDYDTITGEILHRHTHQGHSHESAWARGQAWGLYGFTMTCRFTGNKEFLEQAEKIAAFILEHPNLPEDMIPYWDFNAPGIPDEPRDASSAAITASALLELSTYSDQGDSYAGSAVKILENLSSPEYLSNEGESKGFLIKHSTGHKPGHSEVDVPIIYGDYYYIEAMKRYRILF